MIRYMIPLMAAATLGTPVAAAEVQIPAQGPVVELSVNEVVRSAPDTAQIGAGVMTRASTAQEAVRRNAEAMDKLIEKLRQLGIERKDVQTSNFNLNPNYQYNQQTGEQSFVGYDVNNQVSVKLRDIKRAGEVLDALVSAGANNIYGPNFTLDDDREAKAVARSNAFKRGQQMAEEYARMAGYSGVRLLEVSESFQSFGPMPAMEQAVRVASSAKGAATPIEQGDVGVGVTVTVKYEMTR